MSLALKVFMQNAGDFLDVILLYVVITTSYTSLIFIVNILAASIDIRHSLHHLVARTRYFANVKHAMLRQWEFC